MLQSLHNFLVRQLLGLHSFHRFVHFLNGTQAPHPASFTDAQTQFRRAVRKEKVATFFFFFKEELAHEFLPWRRWNK